MTSPLRDRIVRHPLAEPLLDLLAGAPCHVVGGTIRDALLGLDTSDLDVSVAEHGESLAKALAETTGGTAIALGDDRFASYRVVSRAGPDARGNQVKADIWDRRDQSLFADLERRDLTVNSIGLALAGDAPLQDPFGGVDDLEAGILRATRINCFDRDPLRVLRLARFALALDGFSIDGRTATAARSAAPKITRVAVERVREELRPILSKRSSAMAFQTLATLDTISPLYPWIPGDRQGPLVDSATRLDEALERLGDLLPELVWTSQDRFHAANGLILRSSACEPHEAAAKIEGLGRAVRADVRAAIRLISARVPADDDDRRLFLADQGTRWPLALALAGAHGRLELEEIESTAGEIAGALEASPHLLTRPSSLVDGTDAARLMGVEPGPVVGRALRALLDAQILGRVETRAQAEEFLARFDPGVA